MTLFISTTDPTSGWPQASFGCSGIDGKDYHLITYNLKSDEVPEVMNDALNASQFVAGLLNAYFNGIDVRNHPVNVICQMGIVTGPPPDPNQTKIPF